jgi:hypothetical protein
VSPMASGCIRTSFHTVNVKITAQGPQMTLWKPSYKAEILVGRSAPVAPSCDNTVNRVSKSPRENYSILDEFFFKMVSI